MTNQDLVLNIAVNLGRLGRFATDNNPKRISQFLSDTQVYIDQLTQPHPQFTPTYTSFLQSFDLLKSQPPNPNAWAETAFTWAQILTHRAKLA